MSLDDENLMTDDELDNVVGGKSYEISYDSEFFNDLGTNCPRYSVEEARKSNVPYLNVARYWKQFGVTATYNGYSMVYHVDGVGFEGSGFASRRAAMEYVLIKAGKQLDLSSYVGYYKTPH